MIRSMTGFGRSEKTIDGRDIIVEIKSVNHRYFDFNCRVSKGYGFLEEKLKSFVKDRVSRGKIDVYVYVSQKDDTESEVKINHSLAAGYVNALKELQTTYGLTDDISVSTVARYTDLFSVHKAADDEDEIWQCVSTAAEEAINAFISMREKEGEKLKEDVLNRACTILSIVSEIEKRSPKRVKEHEEKVRERIQELLGDVEIDQSRLLTETAIYADKLAVDEETVRLRSHFEQLSDLLNKDGDVGRKIDFIIQEMNRETNTIGSKSNDSETAHMVVDIKAEIEKIREQIQNIE